MVVAAAGREPSPGTAPAQTQMARAAGQWPMQPFPFYIAENTCCPYNYWRLHSTRRPAAAGAVAETELRLLLAYSCGVACASVCTAISSLADPRLLAGCCLLGTVASEWG